MLGTSLAADGKHRVRLAPQVVASMMMSLYNS